MSKTENKLKDGKGSDASTCSIFNRVIKVLKEELVYDAGDEGGTIANLETRLVSDLGADSLDMMEIVMGIESEFNVCIPNVDAEGFVTLGDIVEYISEKTDQGTESNVKL